MQKIKPSLRITACLLVFAMLFGLVPIEGILKVFAADKIVYVKDKNGNSWDYSNMEEAWDKVNNVQGTMGLYNDVKTHRLNVWKGGSIVNIASITGVVGSPGQVAYSSTKGAVIAITKSAAKELSPQQIRVNAVAPGIIKTERFEELYEASGDKIDQRISRIALGRLGTPQDVANAVSFLASDRASYISGHILGVDGCASI